MLVANSLPAINDVTAMELPDIVAEAAKVVFPFSFFLFRFSLCVVVGGASHCTLNMVN